MNKPVIESHEMLKTLYRSVRHCKPKLNISMSVEIYDLLCKKSIELGKTRCELVTMALTYAALIPEFWSICDKVKEFDKAERKRYLDQSEDRNLSRNKPYNYKKTNGRPKGSKAGLTPQG